MFEFTFSQSHAAFLCVHSFVHIAIWALFMTFMMILFLPLSSTASSRQNCMSMLLFFFTSARPVVQNRLKVTPHATGVFGLRHDRIPQPQQPKRISLTRSISDLHFMTALRYMSVCCILSFLSIAYTYPINTCAERDEPGSYLHCRIFFIGLFAQAAVRIPLHFFGLPIPFVDVSGYTNLKSWLDFGVPSRRLFDPSLRVGCVKEQGEHIPRYRNRGITALQRILLNKGFRESKKRVSTQNKMTIK